MMDDFFADILDNAKVVSKNPTPLNRKIVSNDFKNREKFYATFVNNGTSLCKNNNFKIQNKGNQSVGKNKFNSFSNNLLLKNDKSTQGQNLSFSQIFNLAKSNGKVFDSKNQKSLLKNEDNIKQPKDNVAPSIEKPKIPKLIIRKTDYTIRSKDHDAPNKIEYSNNPKLDKAVYEKKSSEKDMFYKVKNQFSPLDNRREVKKKRLSSSNIDQISKIPHKFSRYTEKEYKNHFKSNGRLQNYNKELSEDSSDSMDDFIVDDGYDLPTRTEFEEALKSVSRYDKKRRLDNERLIKENEMMASYSDIRKEEKRSFKLALKEDLRELKKGSHAL